MLVRQNTSYMDLYDTALNVERAVTEQSNYFNKQRDSRGRGITEGTFNRGNNQSQEQYRLSSGNQYSNNSRGGQHPNASPKVTCNVC